MNVAIMGYGTIGSGVYKVLEENADIIKARAGEEIKVTRILDLRDFSNDPIANLVTDNVEDIVSDESIGLVVETMGGVEPAYTFVKKMLLAGKSVTTSNKALVAEKGPELIEIASKNNINFQFEASVGGGIPIIRPLLSCVTGDVIEEITAICNGTTNFILTKMVNENWDFETALKKAQELGYAEKDPTADVDGHDSCRKIAILTSLSNGKTVYYQDIPTEGIRNVSLDDFKYAHSMGMDIKLLAMSRLIDGEISARVAPFMIDKSHPLAPVSDVFNAIFIRGNMLGDAMFYGSGAGSLPTASAVVGDLVDMTRNKDRHLPLTWDEKRVTLADSAKEEYKFFVRIKAEDENIKSSFNNAQNIDVSLAGEMGFVTDKMSEKDFASKIKDVSPLSIYRLL